MKVSELKEWLNEQGKEKNDFDVLIYDDECDEFIPLYWDGIMLQQRITKEDVK